MIKCPRLRALVGAHKPSVHRPIDEAMARHHSQAIRTYETKCYSSIYCFFIVISYLWVGHDHEKEWENENDWFRQTLASRLNKIVKFCESILIVFYQES